MKNSQEHIKEIIKDLLHHFPNVRVRYDHDTDSDTHTVEVVPSDIYHNDERFNQWQGDSIMSFIENFPCESLCFVTDNSVLGLTAYQHEYEGMFYGKSSVKPLIYTYNHLQYTWDELVSRVPFSELNEHFLEEAAALMHKRAVVWNRLAIASPVIACRSILADYVPVYNSIAPTSIVKITQDDIPNEHIITAA